MINTETKRSLENTKIKVLKDIYLLDFNLKSFSNTFIISGIAVSLLVAFRTPSVETVRQEIVQSENTLMYMA